MAISSFKDILKSLNNATVGVSGSTGAYTGGNINGVTTITAGRGAAVNSKLFNQLMQFDRVTSSRIQAFVGGRFVIVIGQMPAMMERLHPEATNYMRILFTSTVIGVDGFADNELATEQVQALTEQNSYSVVTKATGTTQSLTLTFMTIFQGLPIYRYITRWMNYVQNRGSGVSSYPHLTEVDGKGKALEYHEGNHSMNMAYMVVDPSMRYVEDGAFCYSMVPTSNLQSQILNQTWGESAPKQYAVPFKAMVITTTHEGVRNVLNNVLKKWTQNIALDDNQVNLDDITEGILY